MWFMFFFSFHFLVISFHLFHLSSHFGKNFGQIRNRLESQGKFSYALKIGLPTERLLFKSIGGGGCVVREMYLPESIVYIGMLIYSRLCFVCILNTAPVTSLDLSSACIILVVGRACKSLIGNRVTRSRCTCLPSWDLLMGKRVI